MNYSSGIIPADTTIIIMFFPLYGYFDIGIVTDNMDSDLESVFIHGKRNEIITPRIDNLHESYDAWTITLDMQDALSLYDLDNTLSCKNRKKSGAWKISLFRLYYHSKKKSDIQSVCGHSQS